jgi:hypothetical protein
MKAIVHNWQKGALQAFLLTCFFVALSHGQTSSLSKEKSYDLMSPVPGFEKELYVFKDKAVHDNENVALRSLFERSRYWLNLTDDLGFFSQMMVAYMTGATNGYDPAIDGLFFGDSQSALTSIVDNQEYIIQGRALPFETTDVVTLGFKSELGGNYTIALNSFDGLFETSNQDIILKDNLASTLTNLKVGSYNFTTDAGVFNNRFEIVYEGLLGLESPASLGSDIVVFKQNQDIVVSSSALISKVQLYDIRGRLLLEKNHVHAQELHVNAGTTNQVLIVRITTEDQGITTRKIVN